MSEENHEIKSWGPQFFIETGNDTVGVPGRTVYFMGAKTKDGAHVYNQSFHADRGEIKIKGRDIILQASDNLILKCDNIIQIGNKNGTTDLIDIRARKVNIKGRGGNIANLLKTSNIFKSFAKSYVPGGFLTSFLGF